MKMMKNKRSILVVDDANFTRKKIISILNNKPNHAIFDVDFQEACNGREALDLLLNQDIDVVLLDINMPVMNGIDFLYELENKKLKKKIVVITADTSVTLEELSEFGIEDLLFKPFKPEVLWKILIEFNEELLWEESEDYYVVQSSPRKENKVISKNVNSEKIEVNEEIKKTNVEIKNRNASFKSKEESLKEKSIEVTKKKVEAKNESVNRIEFDKIRKELKEKNNKQDKDRTSSSINKTTGLNEMEVNLEAKDEVKKGVKRQKRQMSLDIDEEVKKIDKEESKAPDVEKIVQNKKGITKKKKKLAETLPKKEPIEEVKEDFELEIEANIDNDIKKEKESIKEEEFDLEDFDGNDGDEKEEEEEFLLEEPSEEDEIEFEIDNLESEISNDFVENVIGVNGDGNYISEINENKLINDLKAARESEYGVEIKNTENEDSEQSKEDIYSYELLNEKESKNDDDITFVLDDSDDSEEEFDIDIDYDDSDSVDILPPIK